MSEQEIEVMIEYGRQEGERTGFRQGFILASFVVVGFFVLFYETIPEEEPVTVRYVLADGTSCP